MEGVSVHFENRHLTVGKGWVERGSNQEDGAGGGRLERSTASSVDSGKAYEVNETQNHLTGSPVAIIG